MQKAEMQMTDVAPEQDAPAAPRKSRLPLIAGAVAALVLGGAGFFVVYAGIFPPRSAPGAQPVQVENVAYVPIEPLVVNLPPESRHVHLRFVGQLEVNPAHRQEVANLMPRVVDVLNAYLRALDPAEMERPGALIVLRAQMLRRVRIVTGEDRVRDLLVSEFILH